MAHLVIDSRERGLISFLAATRATYHVASLPAGDVLCTYGDDNTACSWVMERKRADDLACSIKDGRWREQTSRLFASGHRVFFVIEGDLRFLDGMYASMIDAPLVVPPWGADVQSVCALQRLGWKPSTVEKIKMCVGFLPPLP